jgi:RNA polymerase sigma factor (sigma-70 family)
VIPSILQQVAANDQSAMDECLNRYGGLVWALVKRRCPLQADAEDVVQEVFMDIWKNAHRYDPSIAEESTFIAMITRRRLIDRSRRQQRLVDTAPLTEVPEPASDDLPNVEVNDEAARIREIMQQLSDDERRVIELAIDRGMSQSQIAEHIKMSLGTVKSHARRGMLRLRSLVGVATPVKGGDL